MKKYFNGTTSGAEVTSVSGSLDMTGLSYYPVDYNGGLSFGAISSLKFCNYEIETGESATGGNTDSAVRSTTDTANQSQHYMMHCGLFRNAKGGITLGGNMTIQGNIGILTSGSGFLVCDTFGGDTNTYAFTNGSHTITLDGAYVNGVTSSTDNAPMLVSKVRSNTRIELNGVKSQNYTAKINAHTGTNPWFAATSLIGEVGNETASVTEPLSSNMNVKFSNIVLDGRTADVSDSTENTALNTAYGSTRTIFSKATLLGHFVFGGNDSSGEYNFDFNEDWGNTKHQVTYGQEISQSVDYSGKQKKYFNSEKYVSPVSYNVTEETNAPSFENGFRPYVGKYNESSNDVHVEKYHELMINHSTNNLNEGCGTYNDPYILTTVNLPDLAKIINGDKTPGSDFELCLPLGIAKKNGSDQNTSYSGSGDVKVKWCTGEHASFTCTSGIFSATAGGYTYTISLENVRKYLAGAYYQIESDVELPSNFVGLGGRETDGSTAFRGVIVGKELAAGGYPTVTLNGSAPFITVSNGCVVKNLNFEVPSTATVSLTQGSVETFKYSGGCASYGTVIGKIMGGDNVIDRVGVSFNGTLTAGTKAYIVPAGAYVGVVVNGGLFFRNMENVANKTGFVDSNIGTGFTDMTETVGTTTYTYKAENENNTKYLYINPIIGRVINGYAMTETTSYAPKNADAVMINGTKNYAIANVYKNETDLLNVHDDIAKTSTTPKRTAAIEVPNAQAWFVMSCIVNSGTGSGPVEETVNGKNVKNSSRMADDNISYSETNFKTTHIGTYDDVGCGITSAANIYQKSDGNGGYTDVEDDLFDEDNVEIGSSEKVTPYIVYKYTITEGQTDFYKKFAKSLSGTAREIIMNPAYTSGAGAVWTLPDGYRGIGGLNEADTSNKNTTFNISVNGMTCNKTTINLNMKYQTYRSRQENYKPSEMGFGLFNTFKPNDTMTISDLTLKGNIYVDKYDKDNGAIFHDYGGNYNANYANDARATDKGRVSAGMFAGLKDGNNALTLSNVSIDTIDVHASRRAGGLIGYGRYLTIDSCTGTNITVLGRYDTGGYIGAADESTTIRGGTSTNTVFNINTISQDSGGFHERLQDNRAAGVGGLVGRFGTYEYGSKITDTNQLTISNMNLTQYSSTTGIVQKSMQSSDESGVGGFVGTVAFKTEIRNCNAAGISEIALGGNPGGVVGALYNKSKSFDFNVNSVCVDGTGAASGITYTNRYFGGGVIAKASVNSNVYVDNVQVKNYSLSKSEVGSEYQFGYLGGCIGGKTGGSNAYIKNFTVSNCLFSEPVNYDKGCAGGIIGTLESGNLYGYNIAVEDIRFSGKNGTYKGDIGNSNSTDRNIKIVGFSRQNSLDRDNDGTADDLITSNLYTGSASSSSYIIFSDFSGTGFDGTVNTDKPLLGSSTAEAMVDTAKPYATVNPALTIVADNLLLTGDGISQTVAGLAINDIATDTSNKKYANCGTAASTFYNTYGSKLTTFNTETGANIANDFAVLVMEESDKTKSTAMINNYIQALTNTTDNYASQSSKFNVAIYKMILSNGTFTKSTSANLKLNDGKFYMEGNNIDTPSDTKMFSLIDVQFYDPTVSSDPEIAYHLYIPVLVKKQLNYTFRIATSTGSNYEQDWYDRNDRFGKVGIENYGSPVTLYFDYNYQRTLGELRASIEAGDNLLSNYSKSLTFECGAQKLPHDAANSHANDTVLVLIDRNDNNRPYYAYASDILPGNSTPEIVNLSSFNTVLGGGGTAFSEKNFQDIIEANTGYSVTADRNNTDGKYKRLSAVTAGGIVPNNATIKANFNGTDYYFAKITGSEDPAVTEMYDLSIGGSSLDSDQANFTESYYITIFTPEMPAATSPYHGIIESVNLTGGPMPAKNNLNQSVHVFIGNIITQVTEISQINENDPVIVPTTNDTVRATLKTTISIPDSESQTAFDSSAHIYHSFLVYMTKHENGTKKEIAGDPVCSGSYTIKNKDGDVLDSYEDEPYNPASILNSGNYLEFAEGVDLKGYLTGLNSKVVIESYVRIKYDGEAIIAAQFPPRTSPEQDTHLYTVISGASNIAYDRGRTAFSKTSKEATEIDLLHFYTKTSKAARLEYNAYADENGVYGQLGINARADEKELTNGKAEIKTVAVYDVSDIIQSVPKSQYNRVRSTFELQQKQQNGSYGSPLTISDYLNRVYLDGLTIEDAEHTLAADTADYKLTDDSTKYIFDIVRYKLVQSGDTAEAVMSIPITFDVYSGAGYFEENGSMYSNYKVYITVELYNSSAPETSVYTLKKHIVYTNAKLISDFIG